MVLVVEGSHTDQNPSTLTPGPRQGIDSGAFDPFDALADAVRKHPNAWLHIDGSLAWGVS